MEEHRLDLFRPHAGALLALLKPGSSLKCSTRKEKRGQDGGGAATRFSYLGPKDVEGEAIEAADDGLLNVQAEAVQSPHRRQQQARPAGTEHVNVDRSAFPLPHLHLRKKQRSEIFRGAETGEDDGGMGELKLTLGSWLFGLGSELDRSSSLTRHGSVGGVGVNGWKLGVAADPGKEEPDGVDSSSLWRSLILCRSSFKYSIASPRMDARSICPGDPRRL